MRIRLNDTQPDARKQSSTAPYEWELRVLAVIARLARRERVIGLDVPALAKRSRLRPGTVVLAIDRLTRRSLLEVV